MQSSQRSVEGGGTTTVDPADAAANLEQARADVIAGLRRGRAPLNLGVEEHLIKGGYDAIEFELVESLGDGVYGEIDLGTQTDFGRVGVKIRVSHLGASTLAEARATIGHEIRHLSPANIRLSPKPPPGMHQSFSPQERDAERFGIRTRRFFE